MLETTKRPAPVRMALERGGLLMVGVVFAVGTAWLASAKGPPVMLDPGLPRVLTATGTGDDTTVVMDVTTGSWLAGWEAPCPVSVLLVGWDDVKRTSEQSLGTGRTGTAQVALTKGGYFFDVTGSCDWTVRLSPT